METTLVIFPELARPAGPAGRPGSRPVKGYGAVQKLGLSPGPLPADSVRLTAVFPATWVPAWGFWLMTFPAGTVQLRVVDTEPTLSPAEVIALCALPSSRPTTFGTVARSHSVRPTWVPNGSRVPGARSLATTWPALDAGQLVVWWSGPDGPARP